MSEYIRYCNKDLKNLKCKCYHKIEIGEYYEDNGKVRICNECYDKFLRNLYKEQTEKLNILHVLCPRCEVFIRLEFNYEGGDFYGGQDSGIVCKECGKDFYIELDVRSNCNSLNE